MPLTKDRPPSYSEANQSPGLSFRSGSFASGPPASATGKSASKSARYSSSSRGTAPPPPRRSSSGYSPSGMLVLPQNVHGSSGASSPRSPGSPPMSPRRADRYLASDRRRSSAGTSPSASPRVSRSNTRGEKASPHWSPRSRPLDALSEEPARDQDYFRSAPRKGSQADSPGGNFEKHSPESLDAGVVALSSPSRPESSAAVRGKIPEGNAFSLFPSEAADVKPEPRMSGTIRHKAAPARTLSQPARDGDRTPGQTIAALVRDRSSARSTSKGVSPEAGNVLMLPMAGAEDGMQSRKKTAEEAAMKDPREEKRRRTKTASTARDDDDSGDYIDFNAATTTARSAQDRRGRRKPPPALDENADSLIPPPPRRERTGSTPVSENAPASPTTSTQEAKAKKTKMELEREGNAFVIEGALFGEPPTQVLVVPNEDVDKVKKAVEKEQDLEERRSRAASRTSGRMQRGAEASLARDEDSSTPKEREAVQAKKRTSAVRTSRVESGAKGRRTGTIPHKKKDAPLATKEKAAKPASPSKKRESRGGLLGLPKVSGWQRFKTTSTATPTIASSTAGAEEEGDDTETEAEVKKDKGKARARSSRSASEAGDLGVGGESEAAEGQAKSWKDEAGEVDQAAVATEDDDDDDDDAFVTDIEDESAADEPAAAESTSPTVAEATEQADGVKTVQPSSSYSGQLMALVGGVGSGLFAWVSSPQNGDERVSSSPVVPLVEVTESKAHDVESLTGETVKSADPADPAATADDGVKTSAAAAASTSAAAAANDAEAAASDSDSQASDSDSDESDKPPSYKAAAASKKRSKGADVVDVAPATASSKTGTGVQRRDSKVKSRAVPSRKISARRHSRQDSKGSTTKAARPKSGGFLDWDKRTSRRERMFRSDSTPAAIGRVDEENEDAARPAVEPATKKRFSLAFWGRTNSSPAVVKEVKEVKEPKGPNRFSVVLTSTGNVVKGGGTKAGTAVKAGGTRAGTVVKAGGARAGLAVRQNSARAGDAVKAGGDSVGRVSMRGLLSFMNFTDTLAGAEKPAPTEDHPARRRTVAFSDDKAAGAAEIKRARPVFFGRVTVTNDDILDLRRQGDRYSVVPAALLPLVKDVPKSALKVKVAPADENAQAGGQSATIEGTAEKGVVLVVGETAEGAEGPGGLPTQAEVIAVMDGPVASGSGTHPASPEEIHVDLPTSAGGGTGIVSRIAAYLPIPGALYNDEPEAMTPAHEAEPSYDGHAPVEDKEGVAGASTVDEPGRSTPTETENEQPLESPVLPFAAAHQRGSSSSTAGPPGTPPRTSSTDVPRSRSYSALTALAGAFGGKSPPASTPSSPNGRERAPRDPAKIFSSEEYNQQPDLVSGRLY